MIYPALQIGTQWVMVDKTRLIELGEYYVNPSDMSIHKASFPWGHVDWQPIIAAFPKLEGVPLIPEEAFTSEKYRLAQQFADKKIGILDYDLQTPEMNRRCYEHGLVSGAFTMGFEAAGGYTREDMKRSFDCGRNYQLTGEDNFRELMESFDAKPITAFDCEENPDGSLKIENDTIVVKKVIR